MEIYIVSQKTVDSSRIVEHLNINSSNADRIKTLRSLNCNIQYNKLAALNEAEKLLLKEQKELQEQIQKLVDKNKEINLKLTSCRDRKKIYLYQKEKRK